ncbi:unnamed protein product [Heligmosomoides polygyrus]|uniref:Origin recognition complex subunit 1 n=1 Tax=Heligmosomoides polygyrus TaxID=6339 RepID=A0A183GSH4_HELPZ|nr:unnamed protein product [Heligmosomoides polygyrus]
MMEARKIKYDVIGLTETRRHLTLHVAYGSKGVGGQAESSAIELVWLCASFDCALAPTPDCDDEDVEAFYVELEKYYKEGHFTSESTVWSGMSKVKRLSEFDQELPEKLTASEAYRPTMKLRFPGEKAAKFKKRNPRTTINWDLYTSLAGLWEDTVMDIIDEEYDHFVHHLRDSAKEAENLKTTKRRLSPETLKKTDAPAWSSTSISNHQLTSDFIMDRIVLFFKPGTFQSKDAACQINKRKFA